MSNYFTFSESNDLVLADIKSNLVPALLGEAGIGKSSFLKDLAQKDLKSEVFVLSINNLSGREDLTGARLVKDEKSGEYMQMFFPHEAVTSAIIYAKEHPDESPILFLDEFNRTTEDVTSAVFQLITERKLGSKSLPDNLRMVVAGNDAGNVSSVDTASVTRLVIYHMSPDLPKFLSVNPDMNPFVKSFLQTNPTALLYTKHANDTALSTDDDDADLDAEFGNASLVGAELLESFNQIATPRTWTGLSKKFNTLGLDHSGSNDEHAILARLTSATQLSPNVSMLDTVIQGHIGEGEIADALSRSIQTYYENTFPTNFVNTNAAPTVPDDTPLEHESEIQNAIQEIKNTGTLDESKIDKNVVADSLIWLTNDENTKAYTTSDLTSLLTAWSNTILDLPKSEFQDQRLSIFTKNIANGTITADSQFLKILNRNNNLVENSAYVKKMIEVLSILLNYN